MSGPESGVASARAALVAGATARLRAIGNMPVYHAPPVRGGVPYAVVDPPSLADWSGVGWQGREGRLTVNLHDQGVEPVRLDALIDGVETALELMAAPGAPDLGGGWRLFTCRSARMRWQKGGGDRWTAVLDFAVRLARLQ